MNTGRYIVVDQKSGRRFWAEPIADRNDKTTDRTMTNGGFDGESIKNKSQVQGGSVHDEDSIITENNGFTNIITLPVGVSPNDYIEQLCRNGKKVGE